MTNKEQITYRDETFLGLKVYTKTSREGDRRDVVLYRAT